VLEFRPITILGVAVEHKDPLIGTAVDLPRFPGRGRWRDLFKKQEPVHGFRSIGLNLRRCWVSPATYVSSAEAGATVTVDVEASMLDSVEVGPVGRSAIV